LDDIASNDIQLLPSKVIIEESECMNKKGTKKILTLVQKPAAAKKIMNRPRVMNTTFYLKMIDIECEDIKKRNEFDKKQKEQIHTFDEKQNTEKATFKQEQYNKRLQLNEQLYEEKTKFYDSLLNEKRNNIKNAYKSLISDKKIIRKNIQNGTNTNNDNNNTNHNNNNNNAVNNNNSDTNNSINDNNAINNNNSNNNRVNDDTINNNSNNTSNTNNKKRSLSHDNDKNVKKKPKTISNSFHKKYKWDEKVMLMSFKYDAKQCNELRLQYRDKQSQNNTEYYSIIQFGENIEYYKFYFIPTNAWNHDDTDMIINEKDISMLEEAMRIGSIKKDAAYPKWYKWWKKKVKTLLPYSYTINDEEIRFGLFEKVKVKTTFFIYPFVLQMNECKESKIERDICRMENYKHWIDQNEHFVQILMIGEQFYKTKIFFVPSSTIASITDYDNNCKLLTIFQNMEKNAVEIPNEYKQASQWFFDNFIEPKDSHMKEIMTKYQKVPFNIGKPITNIRIFKRFVFCSK